MNRGNMGKQISTAPKSKSKKVKKMQFGGMATTMPGPALSDMSQMRRIDPSMAGAPTEVATPMPGKPRMGPGRPGMGDMPRIGLPGKPGMPGPTLRGGPAPMPPGFRGGPAPMPPGFRGGPAPMPPGFRGGPAPMPGPVFRGGPAPMPPGLRGGPAPMPDPVFRTQGPASMPAMAMAKGGKAKKMAKGGKIDGCCIKGHTKARMK